MRKALLALLAILVFGFSVKQVLAEMRSLSITASYRERIALPPDAILEVELLDVSRADVPSVTMSSQSYQIDRVPFSVSLSYDDQKIDSRMSYVVAARILSGERVLFRTTSAHPVITRGSPEHADLVLERMSGGQSGPVSVPHIAGVSWSVTEIAGRALVADDPPTIAFLEDGSFSMYGGCNRFHGKAEVSNGQIAFLQPTAGTSRACPPNRMKLEQDILHALEKTVAYQRVETNLAFRNASGVVTARFREAPE